MTRSPVGIRRIVLVVLDGFRPELIDSCHLTNLQRIAYGGAWTMRAEPTVSSVNAPALFRDVAERVTAELGVAGSRFIGRDSITVLRAAQSTLAMQRRGLILMHWADAGRAASDYGYGSAQLREAATDLDATIGILAAHLEVPRDPGTVLIVVSDHGRPLDHSGQGFRDDREALVIAGASVVQSPLPKTVSIMDVAPTILWALGLGGSNPTGALRPAFRASRDHLTSPALALRLGA